MILSDAPRLALTALRWLLTLAAIVAGAVAGAVATFYGLWLP